MKLRALVFALGFFAMPAAVFAQEAPAPVPTPTPAFNQFNDPAMSFTAPPDWHMAPLPPHSPTEFDRQTVVAGWVRKPGTEDQQTITLSMENFQGNLDGWHMVNDNELRQQSDSVFIKNNQRTTLSNGMPAYWEEISIGSGFDEIKRYEYVWTDGVRGIVLAIMAHYGKLDEATARRDLANASGVLYPVGRY